MRFHLTKNLRISFDFSNVDIIKTSTWSGDVCYRYLMIACSVLSDDDNSAQKKEACKRLKKTIYGLSKLLQNPKGSFPEFQVWNLDVYAGILEHGPEEGANLKGYVKLQGLFAGNCLELLSQITGGQARVQVKLKVFEGRRYGEYPTCRIITKEMKINANKSGLANCEDFDIEYPKAYFGNWQNVGPAALCTVTVTAPDTIMSGVYVDLKLTNNAQPMSASVNQNILESKLLADLTIIPDNGSVIKAHKIFLASQSPVFLAMFESDMKESHESVLEVPDISEDVARALLKYLYYEDIKSAEEDSLKALALLRAADKYDIKTLERKMKELILGSSNDWFDTDVAVKLFMFGRNLVPEDEQLKMKAARVLKTNIHKLEESSTYQELFQKQPQVAMELCKYAFAA